MSHRKKFFYFFCLSTFVISIFFFSNINFFYETRIKFGKAIIIGINFLFKKKNYENLKTKINSGLLTSKFEDLKFKTINLNKRDFFMRRPLGYLEIIDDNIIYLAADGNILVIEDDLLKNEIKSNIKSFFNNEIDLDKNDLLLSYALNPIRDLLYHEGILYVVILHKELFDSDVRFSTAVLKGKFNYDYIDFEYFFKPDIYESGKIDTTHVGGRIVVNQQREFYLAVPDFYNVDKVNNLNNIFGKILKIKSIDNYEIISIGHRNPQGLYYDKENDLLIESEHGPSAGDEINLIRFGKNYGWPTTSTGIHDTHVKYHDHIKQGFEPPIYSPSIYAFGPSQIIKISKKSKFNFKGQYILASLSGHDKYVGNHLYLFKIVNKKKAIISEKIFVNDRVRDIIYDKRRDRIILTLENQQAVGIITKN